MSDRNVVHLCAFFYLELFLEWPGVDPVSDPTRQVDVRCDLDLSGSSVNS